MRVVASHRCQFHARLRQVQRLPRRGRLQPAAQQPRQDENAEHADAGGQRDDLGVPLVGAEDCDEQRQRLQERLDDPAKHWKFDEGDLQVRAQWDEYQMAYQQLLRATSTPWAPWNVVPADSKTHRNLMIATQVRDALKGLKLCYPPGAPALARVRLD